MIRNTRYEELSNYETGLEKGKSEITVTMIKEFGQ